jgi:hypothetical protein
VRVHAPFCARAPAHSCPLPAMIRDLLREATRLHHARTEASLPF